MCIWLKSELVLKVSVSIRVGWVLFFMSWMFVCCSWFRFMKLRSRLSLLVVGMFMVSLFGIVLVMYFDWIWVGCVLFGVFRVCFSW